MVRIIKNCSNLIEDLLLVKEYSELEGRADWWRD
jgi:hypothetical protein